jgi:hypothetical protein
MREGLQLGPTSNQRLQAEVTSFISGDKNTVNAQLLQQQNCTSHNMETEVT